MENDLVELIAIRGMVPVDSTYILHCLCEYKVHSFSESGAQHIFSPLNVWFISIPVPGECLSFAIIVSFQSLKLSS